MLLSSETGRLPPYMFSSTRHLHDGGHRLVDDFCPIKLPEAPRHPSVDQHSAVIRKQLDWVAEAAHRIFADAFEIEIAVDEIGERAR